MLGAEGAGFSFGSDMLLQRAEWQQRLIILCCHGTRPFWHSVAAAGLRVRATAVSLPGPSAPLQQCSNGSQLQMVGVYLLMWVAWHTAGGRHARPVCTHGGRRAMHAPPCCSRKSLEPPQHHWGGAWLHKPGDSIPQGGSGEDGGSICLFAGQSRWPTPCAPVRVAVPVGEIREHQMKGGAAGRWAELDHTLRKASGQISAVAIDAIACDWLHTPPVRSGWRTRRRRPGMRCLS